MPKGWDAVDCRQTERAKVILYKGKLESREAPMVLRCELSVIVELATVIKETLLKQGMLLTCTQENNFRFKRIQKQSILRKPDMQRSETGLEVRNIARTAGRVKCNVELRVISVLTLLDVMTSRA
jgi:hypothetical protein